MEYPIVYITDNEYVDYTLVSIKSVLSTTKKNVKIYVICNDVSDSNKERLKIHECIELKEYAPARIRGYGRFKHVSASAYIKFDLPSIIPEDICLYIDGDTIAVKDITSIFDYDVSGHLAAVMEDFGRSYIWPAKMGIDPFYAGTMLLNLKKMRENNISDLLHLEKQRLGNEWNEMEVFNKVFMGKVVHIPIKYCVSFEKIKFSKHKEYRDIALYNNLYGTTYSNINQLLEDAAIYHFHGDNKQVYEHREVFEIVDSVEHGFLLWNAPRVFIFSNVCRFETHKDFREAIAELKIRHTDLLIFLNTAPWLTRFIEDIPPARVQTIHRFRRNASGWWGLDEILGLKEKTSRDYEILLLDNQGDISSLQGELKARVVLANYPQGKIPTTGFYAFQYARLMGYPSINLVNFYGSGDHSTPHFKPHGWDYEEMTLAKESHISFEPGNVTLPKMSKIMDIGVPTTNKEMATNGYRLGTKTPGLPQSPKDTIVKGMIKTRGIYLTPNKGWF